MTDPGRGQQKLAQGGEPFSIPYLTFPRLCGILPHVTQNTPNTPMPVDAVDIAEKLAVKKTFDELRERFEDDDTQDSFNLLLTGSPGTGKTSLLTTARKPVLIDSFDPGGTKVKEIRELIASGDIFADTRWEKDDPENPTVFRDWERDMKRRQKAGTFDILGTYALDSLTSFSDAIMNRQLGKRNAVGEAPQWATDYHPQKTAIVHWMKQLKHLPCDFILIGHLIAVTDEVTGKTEFHLRSVGDTKVTIPLLFDEVYVTQAKQKGTKTEYNLLVSSSFRYSASSRLLGRAAALENTRPPDLKAILKEAGMPWQDLTTHKP